MMSEVHNLKFYRQQLHSYVSTGSKTLLCCAINKGQTQKLNDGF